jgi:hypothetical protein
MVLHLTKKLRLDWKAGRGTDHRIDPTFGAQSRFAPFIIIIDPVLDP